MTERQRTMLVALCDAILEAIEAMGERGVPSGHLYAHLMGKMSLGTYESIISALVKAGKVRQANHVLYAVK